MDKLLQDYLSVLRFERSLSPHTISAYQREISILLRFLQEKNLTLQECRAEDIRLLITQLRQQELTGRSIARALTVWRQFFEYLISQSLISDNPCHSLHPPKHSKPLPQILNTDEVCQLLSKPEDVEDERLWRDYAIFELCYSSGLRVTELVRLDIFSIDLVEGSVTVLGKGNKMRIVPVGKMAIMALKNWLSLRSKWAKDSALFITQKGRRLNARTIQLRLKQWASQKGLTQNIYPHLLRHSFASHILQSSGDLRAVQEMLGHTSLKATQIYTQLDFQHLASVYDKTHPRAKK